MNCKQVEELMPLYVEGDLQADEEMKVAAHLQHCQVCAQLSDEYEKSQSWLRSYTPPEFDNAFFAGVKQNVMQEIDGARPRTIFFERFFERVFGRGRERWSLNPAYAFAALLVLAGALTLFFFLKQGDQQTPQQARVTTPEPEEPAPAPDEDKQKEPGIDNKGQVANVNPRRNRRFVQRKERRVIEEPLPEIDPEPGLDLVSQRGDEKISNLPEGIAGDTTLPKGMLKIEFQTSDPNIRIIWFAPKPADTDSRKIDAE